MNQYRESETTACSSISRSSFAHVCFRATISLDLAVCTWANGRLLQDLVTHKRANRTYQTKAKFEHTCTGQGFCHRCCRAHLSSSTRATDSRRPIAEGYVVCKGDGFMLPELKSLEDVHGGPCELSISQPLRIIV